MTGVTSSGLYAETVPGLSAAAHNWRRRHFLDCAYAFQIAADLDLGQSRFAYECWELAGATDSGTFRGECRIVADNGPWRIAAPQEPSHAAWIVPLLVSGEIIQRARPRDDLLGNVVENRYPTLEAADLLVIEPDTGEYRMMNQLASSEETKKLLASIGRFAK